MELRLRAVPIALLAVLLSSPGLLSQAGRKPPAQPRRSSAPPASLIPATSRFSKRRAETNGCKSIA